MQLQARHTKRKLSRPQGGVDKGFWQALAVLNCIADKDQYPKYINACEALQKAATYREKKITLIEEKPVFKGFYRVVSYQID